MLLGMGAAPARVVARLAPGRWMKLELWGGSWDDDQELNYGYRWVGLLLLTGCEGMKHARRLVKVDLVPANSAEISVCKDRDLDAATHDAPRHRPPMQPRSPIRGRHYH